MTRIIVSGPIANKPGNGGIAWNVLSYVRGLKRLGHEVAFVEAIAPEACVDANRGRTEFADSANLAYFKAIVTRFDLCPAALLYNRGEQAFDAGVPDIADLARHAGLLVNISGNLPLDPPFDAIPCKVYIDEDPGYTQFWQVTGVAGLNIGREDCTIPRGDYDWRPTRQPVVLEDWPVAPAAPSPRFTTVGSWRGAYGSVEFEGHRFGLKAHEFRKFVSVPRLVADATFEIALDIHEGDAADRDALLRNRWCIEDPSLLVADPVSFGRYVRDSAAEFSVAQGIYVDTNSGWFSDRSARYLASGRPVLVQDTGFGRSIPVGEGLLAFGDLDGAVAGCRAILDDYDCHARAARALAETHFSSDRILSNLLEQVL
jgi:hypothetical protein